MSQDASWAPLSVGRLRPGERAGPSKGRQLATHRHALSLVAARLRAADGARADVTLGTGKAVEAAAEEAAGGEVGGGAQAVGAAGVSGAGVSRQAAVGTPEERGAAAGHEPRPLTHAAPPVPARAGAARVRDVSAQVAAVARGTEAGKAPLPVDARGAVAARAQLAVVRPDFTPATAKHTSLYTCRSEISISLHLPQ